MTFLFLVIFALVLWVGRLHARLSEVEARETAWSENLARLRVRLDDLTRRQGATQRPHEPEPAPRPEAAVVAPAAANAPVPAPASPVHLPAPPPTPAAPRPAATPAAATPAMAAERAVPRTPRVEPPARPAVEPTADEQVKAPFDWEELIGVRLFSWAAGVALALGAIFFLGYSIKQGWLQPPVRVAIGLIVGVGLLVVCELKAARKYPTTANALDGSAIVILFSTFYAAYHILHMYGPAAAFALLALVTVVAVLLSVRRDSVFIALLGLLGGFSTPALLSTGEDSPFTLFGYLLLLNAGLAVVAYRKRWPLLVALSMAFTTLYQWGWVMTFLTPGKLPLAAGIFLAFPILGFLALGLLGRAQVADGDTAVRPPWFADSASLNGVLPLLFALFMASSPVYGEHAGLLFGFLFCMAAGLFAVALWRGPGLLHLVGGACTLLVFVTWTATTYSYAAGEPAAAYPMVLAFVALFVAFYLAAGLAARHGTRRLEGPGRLAVYTAPLLLFMFPALAAVEPSFASPGLPFAVLFLLLGAISAFAIAEDAGLTHFVGAFLALAAEAVWSANHLTEDRLIPALAIYGAFGLLYLGVPLAARRLDRALRPERLGGVQLLLSIGLLFFVSVGPIAASSLWGLALLLAILNAALLVESGATRLPLFAFAGTLLSWLVLGAWWVSGSLTVQLVPALVVLAGFTLLTLAGHLWLGGQLKEEGLPFQAGMGLALVGHLFLFFVASQASLAVPPWPMLAILGVLDLAFAATALRTRRAELFGGALACSQLIVLVWVGTVGFDGWPMVSLFAAAVVAGGGVATAAAARRRGCEPAHLDRFDIAASGGLVLGQVVLIAASFVSIPDGSLGVRVLMPFHVLFLGSLLVLAAIRRWHVLAVIGVLPTVVATWGWQAFHLGAPYWADHLVFATPIYLLVLAYPMLLGRRIERSLEPHLAAVLASGSFFHVARLSIIVAGGRAVIGALPIVQAALMAVLLRQLLRVERPGDRTIGRLALVAGTVLGFVTVAIPLQLENQWVTIGWALEGAALAWLFTRIPHRGLFWSSLGLLAVVFVRLANPELLRYAPRSETPILNWYLYTYLVSAAAMMAAGWQFARTNDEVSGGLRGSNLAPAAGTVILFLLLNIEIADFFATGSTITFNLSAGLAQNLTYTLGWAVFAVCLLSAGIGLGSHAARIAAIALLTVAVLKGFLWDVSRLEDLYRVMAFVGLAVCLSLVALALQRFVLAPRAGARR
jgi:uncharacterized membrane protein